MYWQWVVWLEPCVVLCRERKNRPLKNPLKELVVVHTDKDFLADIEGNCNLSLSYNFSRVFVHQVMHIIVH